MFEAAEVGHKVGKKEFARAERKLRTELLEAQHRLRETDVPVVVIVSGVEAAGRNEVVNRLQEWLDTRGVSTAAFWDESDEERERPRHWRFWRQMPPRGTIAVFFGSWYTQPIVQRTFRKLGEAEFQIELRRITQLERMLTDDGALIVKLWFHISRKEQHRRLKAIARERRRKLTEFEKAYSRHYERFAAVSETALRATDQGHAPWHIVDAGNRRYRDLMAGRLLLAAAQQRLALPAERRRTRPRVRARVGDAVSVLDRVDLAATITKAAYGKKLKKLQLRLNELIWVARETRHSTVLVLEGWDAAGKGGAIRRLTAAMDARLYRVIPITAPTDEEKAHHYLWRFWRHLPRAGYVTIYDRSWYGRVLVERVEGFAQPEHWARAYGEINAFEEQLTAHGICVSKFWLHLSPEEQLRRFHEREQVAYKQHKIGEEDWRNRKKWDAYVEAVDEMVARTSTTAAPWTLVAANDKKHARLTVLQTLCDRLEQALGRG
jgi:AMP-polyphosphate phosphotransferase